MDSDKTLFLIGLKNLDHSELESFVNIYYFTKRVDRNVWAVLVLKGLLDTFSERLHHLFQHVNT